MDGRDVQAEKRGATAWRWLLLLTLLSWAALTWGCTQEEQADVKRGIELVTPPEARPQPAVTGTATPASAQSARAQQFVDIGKLEAQIGAFEAAVSAFEAALQLDPSNQEAQRLLEAARKSAGQPPTPGASPTPIRLEIPMLPAVSLPPAPPATPTPAPKVVGCVGDEKLVLEPSSAAVGDQVLLSVTSIKEHQNVRLAAPSGTEFLGMVSQNGSFLWQWRYPAQARGEFTFYFYVDFNTLCVSGNLTVTGRWQPLSSGLPPPQDFTITALAVSPAYPFDSTLFLAFEGAGVYKSVDAGAGSPTFFPINEGLGDLGVMTLAVSPNYRNDKTLFVGTKLGRIYRSTDGGGSWVIRQTFAGGGRGDVTALAVSPNFATDTTLLATVDGQGVYTSQDRGDNWYPMNDGLKDRTMQAVGISADYANDGLVYTGTRFSGAYRFGGSAQASTLSLQAPTDLTPKFCLVAGVGADKQVLRCLAIAVTAGTAGDKQTFALNQPGSVTYTYKVRNEEGQGPVFDITIKDDSGTPDNTNDDVVIGRVDKLEVGESKTFTRRFYIAQDRLSIATATGRAELNAQSVFLTATDDALVDAPEWSSTNLGLEDLWIRSLAISPFYANDRTLFAGGTYGGLFKHDGKQWKQVNEGLAEKWAWIDSIVLSPRFPRDPTIYVGTSSGVYRSTNGGETWVTMRAGLPSLSASPDLNRGVRALAISPDFGNDRTVFAGVWRDNIYRVRD